MKQKPSFIRVIGLLSFISAVTFSASLSYAEDAPTVFGQMTSCTFVSPFYGQLSWRIFGSIEDAWRNQINGSDAAIPGLIVQSGSGSMAANQAFTSVVVHLNPATNQLNSVIYANSAMSSDLEVGPDGAAASLTMHDVNGSNLNDPIAVTCEPIKPSN